MEKSNIQLGSLDYDTIKNDIKNYLKQQDTLSDFDYEGSALNVILDVLAYNTLYYGYYSNMVANEMFLDTAQREESLISLVKPLGYVVPGRTSSRARIKVRAGGDRVPKYTKFPGQNSFGTNYTFYNIEEYILDSDGEGIFDIFQGSLVKEAPLTVDQGTQKGFLSGTNIDINTISVEVYDEDSGVWDLWSKVSNIESGLDGFSKVYWLERSELGFFISFGGNFGSETGTQVGVSVGENQSVRVSYLTTDGESGNGVGSFGVIASGSLGNAAIDTLSLSSGGSDKPDLELIRFFAPKWFAGQDRAVTVDDCKAILAANGFVSGTQSVDEQVSIWGGEEMNPPRYGRVFVSLPDTLEATQIASAIELLKQKTCVSIIPEYVGMKEFVLKIGGGVNFDSLQTPLSREQLLGLISQTLRGEYISQFNRSINSIEVSELINGVDRSLSASPFSINIKCSTEVDVIPSGAVETINFNNSCLEGSLVSNSFNSGFTINASGPIRLRCLPNGNINNKGYQPIQAVEDGEGVLINHGVVGSFNPSLGIAKFNSGFAGENFEITVDSSNVGSNTFDITENRFFKLDIEDLTVV
tara:strand:+ start:1553 stop:3304 length:1752 start_codon:yes stop_codon:yes gene_type:complete